MQASMMLFSWLKMIEWCFIYTSVRGISDRWVLSVPISMTKGLFLGDRMITRQYLHRLLSLTVTQSPLKSKLAKDILQIPGNLIKIYPDSVT